MNIDWTGLFKDIQPFTSFLGAVLSLAALGFIARLYAIVKEAQEERIKAVAEQKRIVEERLKNAETDLERTEKWHERRVLDLQDQLTGLLEGEGITTHNLFADPGFADNLRLDIRDTVRSVLDEMTQLQEQAAKQDEPITDPGWHVQMAKACTVSNDWLSAAKHYDEYLKHEEANWEVHFLRGVAYANSRGGPRTQLAGVRSYSEAIAFCPEGVDDSWRARLHTYRGALLKRLNRLDEAESELLLAERWATSSYEVTDNRYNLACIYAMKREKKKMLQYIGQLSSSREHLLALPTKPYFANYRDDSDFLAAVQGRQDPTIGST